MLWFRARHIVSRQWLLPSAKWLIARKTVDNLWPSRNSDISRPHTCNELHVHACTPQHPALLISVSVSGRVLWNCLVKEEIRFVYRIRLSIWKTQSRSLNKITNAPVDRINIPMGISRKRWFDRTALFWSSENFRNARNLCTLSENLEKVKPINAALYKQSVFHRKILGTRQGTICGTRRIKNGNKWKIYAVRVVTM